jgi:hypothetical protein
LKGQFDELATPAGIAPQRQIKQLDFSNPPKRSFENKRHFADFSNLKNAPAHRPIGIAPWRPRAPRTSGSSRARAEEKTARCATRWEFFG